MTPTLHIDLETYSATPIAHGTHAYAADSEIMLFAFALDDAPVEVWDCTLGEAMPDALAAALNDPSVRLVAHNFAFERAVLAAAGIRTDVARWRCTMALAYAHSLPGKLEALCTLFGLAEEESKLADGNRLVHLFCTPRPKSNKLRRATRETHPSEWERFVEYCGRDVDAMRTVMRRMPRWNWSDDEVARFHLDARINERGVAIDMDLASAALKATDAEQKRLAASTNALTDGAVESTTQRDVVLGYLREECGMALADLRSATVERTLERQDLNADVRELLLTRLQASTTSTSKYRSVLRAVSRDGRLRGTLQFRGASRTGRFAGRVFQPQNLPRPPRHLSKKAIADGIEAIKAGGIDLVTDNVMEMCSAALRGLIVAPPGRKLVVADLANIEGRVVAWLAGEQWKLDAFRAYDAKTGPDLYVLAYSKAFGVPVEKVDGDQRQIGKVMELALGFQGGPGAFAAMAAVYGVSLPETVVVPLVKAWRAAHREIASLWYDLDRALREVTESPHVTRTVGRLEVNNVSRGRDRWLRVRLPSGRYLSYPQPEIVLRDERRQWSYMGVNQYTRKWERILSYGGKVVENATQATAADVLLDGMLRADGAGYEVVLSVHDELLTETPNVPEFSVRGLCAHMTTNPAWADGLPLAAEGFEARRYRK